MGVNNEIGIIQPLQEIGDICKAHNIFFHTDAAQAVGNEANIYIYIYIYILGKIEIDVKEMGIDMLSMTGHKIYGPKGVGCLYTNLRGKRRVKLSPQISGGGQQRGQRSGTLPPHV